MSEQEMPAPGSWWRVDGEGGGFVEYVAEIEGEALVRDVESGYFYGCTVPFAELRPLRTAAQRAEDEKERSVVMALQEGTGFLLESECRDIYRLIRDGRIPGVKLEGE